MTALRDLNYSIEPKDVAALERVPRSSGCSPSGIGKSLPTIYKVRFWWESRSRRVYADRASRAHDYCYYVEVHGRRWPISHAVLDALTAKFPPVAAGGAS